MTNNTAETGTDQKQYKRLPNTCGRDKGMLVFPACGGSYYVSSLCSDPLCQACEKRKASKRRKQWEPVVRAMKRPRFITLTTPNETDLVAGWGVLNSAFRRFLGTRLGPRNLAKLEPEALAGVEAACRAEFDKGGIASVEMQSKINKKSLEVKRFCANLLRRGKRFGWLRVRDVIGPGFISREVTRGDGDWNPHGHMVVDGQYIPHAALVVLWSWATGVKSPSVDVRALRTRSKDGVQKFMLEAVKYLTKMWDIPEEDHEEFRAAMRGKKRVWPLGGAKPVKPEKECPCCGYADCKASPGLPVREVGQPFTVAGYVAKLLSPGANLPPFLALHLDGLWQVIGQGHKEDLILKAIDFARRSDRQKEPPPAPGDIIDGTITLGRDWIHVPPGVKLPTNVASERALRATGADVKFYARLLGVVA